MHLPVVPFLPQALGMAVPEAAKSTHAQPEPADGVQVRRVFTALRPGEAPRSIVLQLTSWHYLTCVLAHLYGSTEAVWKQLPARLPVRVLARPHPSCLMERVAREASQRALSLQTEGAGH